MAEKPPIGQGAAGADGPSRERLGTFVTDSGGVRAARGWRRHADTTLTPKTRSSGVAGRRREAARQFLEVRAGETLMDPIDLEISQPLRSSRRLRRRAAPEMTMAELADHLDEIQRSLSERPTPP